MTSFNVIFDITTTGTKFYDDILNNKTEEYTWEIAFMDMDEYMNICAGFHHCTIEDEYKCIDEENIEYLLNVVKKERLPIPYLYVTKKEQEGRHRVVLADRLGIKNIPVACFYKKELLK